MVERKPPASKDPVSKQVRPRAKTLADPKPELTDEDPARHRDPSPVVPIVMQTPSLADRIARWLPLVGVLLTLIIIPSILNASGNTDAQIRSDRITGCRAEANSSVTDANTEARRAELSNEVLTNTFIEVISTRDTARIADLLPKFAPARARLEAADNALEKANNRYQEAVQLSQGDTDRFLRLCRSGRFTPPTTTATIKEPTT